MCNRVLLHDERIMQRAHNRDGRIEVGRMMMQERGLMNTLAMAADGGEGNDGVNRGRRRERGDIQGMESPPGRECWITMRWMMDDGVEFKNDQVMQLKGN